MKAKLEIIFENKDYIAVEKPCGLLSVKDRGGEALEENARLLLEKRGRKVLPVHRLDRDVSGVLVFAGNERSHKFLNALLEKKKVAKKYMALVRGVLGEKEGRIDKPVKEGGGNRSFVHFKGKKAVTEFAVLKRFESATFLELRPLTGRRHQLRVHMYWVGHPVLGDRLYGDLKEQSGYPRIMLHSCLVEFADETGKKISIRSNLPEEFREALESLKYSQ